MMFLTGFDPRFEEAILVVATDGEPAVLVGNECWGTAGAAPPQDLAIRTPPRAATVALGESRSGVDSFAEARRREEILLDLLVARRDFARFACLGVRPSEFVYDAIDADNQPVNVEIYK